MKIISNTAISLDGKITTANQDAISLGSNVDLKTLMTIRNRVDAILVGGNTFRNWPSPQMPTSEIIDEPVDAKQKWFVVVSRSMNFNLTDEFLANKQIRPLFLANKETIPPKFPCEVVGSEQEVTPKWIVNQLEKRGVQKLLLEAGGDIIFQFLHDGFLDEMYVTVCPKIIGGREAPSFVSGAGFDMDHMKVLKLLDHKKIGDEIFLHYEIQK